jgi:ABC-type transport system involved in cytochrome c biogenesis permease subunit
MKTKPAKRWWWALPLLWLAAALPAQGEATHDHHAHARTAPWDPEAVAAFGKLPVLDDGRVKPMSTLASYLLLRVHGRRTFRDGDVSLTPVEWLLDVLFYPEQAEGYRSFLVTDSEVLDAIGLSDVVRNKRDRYSFRELAPGGQKLFEFAQQYNRIERGKRSLIQQQMVDLAQALSDVSALMHYLDFARTGIPVPDSNGVRQTFQGSEHVAFSAVLARLPELGSIHELLSHDPLPQGVDPEKAEKERAAIEAMASHCQQLGHGSYYLAMFPPAKDQPSDAAWLTPEDVVHSALGGELVRGHTDMLAALEQMVAARADSDAFDSAGTALLGRARELAELRNQYDRIELEVAYHEADLFYRALWTFGVAFLIVALSWMWPRARLLRIGSTSLVVLGIALVVVGIVMRCIVQRRPPVLGIYDTIPFITAVGGILAMVIEAINKKRIALPVAALIGVGGMFLAGKNELSGGTDTMKPLIAVLDTNFWLATHVTTVTAGYAAGLLAGLVGAGYVLLRLFGIRRDDRAFYKHLARMTYGVLCFGLLFSVVGTILGGVWANYSWGRFWGWDPKENGALLICLWEIAILHARMGGYLRDLGVCAAAAGGIAVITFSWWDVNMLGVGLHAYGATDGAYAVYVVYGIAALLVALGGVVHLRERRRAELARSAATAPPLSEAWLRGDAPPGT